MELQVRNNQRISGRATATTVSPSSFVQQGTVDWPSLAKATVTASVSVLTRYSGSGVELWTVAFAQVVLGTIRLSAKGESNLNEALAKLHSFGSYGNVMYYGFGVKHIVRTLAESAEGMATVALCAALAECHSLAMSTQVVQEYAKLYSANGGGSLTPSYRQWEALVSSCSGVLAQSPFGSVVEFFMRFHPLHNTGEDTDHGRCGDPTQVAKALEGLAKISSGIMKSMVLTGVSECGFVAAIAQWLLDLKVVVQDADGDTVYPSTGSDAHDYQLLVIYSNHIGASSSVKRTADAYYIDDLSDIMRGDSGSEYLSGRVEWKTAIKQTFGTSASRLLGVPHILGEAVGSAARKYTLPLDGSLPSLHELGPWGLSQAASGTSFIDLAVKTLPELAACNDAMVRAVERSHHDACLHFEKVMAILEEMCGCYTCNLGKSEISERPSTDPIGPAYYKRLPVSTERKTYYCLKALVITVFLLVRQISSLASRPTDLCPKRRGLEILYRFAKQDDPQPYYSELFALNRKGLLDLATLIFGIEPTILRVNNCSVTKKGTTVLVNGGLCFVLDAVTKLSCRAEESLRVHIVPGHIEWDSKTYMKVLDGRTGGSSSHLMPPMILPLSRTEIDAQMQLIHAMTARAVVTEAFDYLRMSYEIKTSSGTICVGPGELCDDIFDATSMDSCSGKECQRFASLDEVFSFSLFNSRMPYGSGEGRVPFTAPQKPNIILFGENEIARCTAMAAKGRDTNLLLQDRECIACCARRALKKGNPHRSVIISRLTVEDAENLIGKPNALVLEA